MYSTNSNRQVEYFEVIIYFSVFAETKSFSVRCTRTRGIRVRTAVCLRANAAAALNNNAYSRQQTAEGFVHACSCYFHCFSPTMYYCCKYLYLVRHTATRTHQVRSTNRRQELYLGELCFLRRNVHVSSLFSHKFIATMQCMVLGRTCSGNCGTRSAAVPASYINEHRNINNTNIQNCHYIMGQMTLCTSKSFSKVSLKYDPRLPAFGMHSTQTAAYQAKILLENLNYVRILCFNTRDKITTTIVIIIISSKQ